MIEVRFPGFPCPPLGFLFKICTSIENWLGADPANVAVVHCMSGRGRTALVAACALSWLGEFDDAVDALEYVCRRRAGDLGMDPEAAGATQSTVSESESGWAGSIGDGSGGGSEGHHPGDGTEATSSAPFEASSAAVGAVCTPSQQRYARYFSRVLGGHQPSPGPLVLRRVIMHGVPDWTASAGGAEAGMGREGAPETLAADGASGAAPVGASGRRGSLGSTINSTTAAIAGSAGFAAVSRFATMVLDAADSADAALATGLLKAAVAVETAAVTTASLVNAAEAGDASAGIGDGTVATLSSDTSSDSAAATGAGPSSAASSARDAVLARGSTLLHGVQQVVAAAASAASETTLESLPPSTGLAAAGTLQQALAVAAGGSTGTNTTGVGTGSAASALAAAVLEASSESMTGPELSRSLHGPGCRPYLQLFRSGTLVYSSAWGAAPSVSSEASEASAADSPANGTGPASAAAASIDDDAAAGALPWASPSDGAVRFPVDLPMAGDILARVRHAGDSGERDTLLRAALHVGFVPLAGGGGVLRLTRAQLDVACNDDGHSSSAGRYPRDFFVEFVFGPPPPTTAQSVPSAVISEGAVEQGSVGGDGGTGENSGGGGRSPNGDGVGGAGSRHSQRALGNNSNDSSSDDNGNGDGADSGQGGATDGWGDEDAPDAEGATMSANTRVLTGAIGSGGAPFTSVAASLTPYDAAIAPSAQWFWADVGERAEARSARRLRASASSAGIAGGDAPSAVVTSVSRRRPQQQLAPVSGPGPSTTEVLGSTKVPSSSLLLGRVQPKPASAAAATTAPALAPRGGDDALLDSSAPSADGTGGSLLSVPSSFASSAFGAGAGGLSIDYLAADFAQRAAGGLTAAASGVFASLMGGGGAAGAAASVDAAGSPALAGGAHPLSSAGGVGSPAQVHRNASNFALSGAAAAHTPTSGAGAGVGGSSVGRRRASPGAPAGASTPSPAGGLAASGRATAGGAAASSSSSAHKATPAAASAAGDLDLEDLEAELLAVTSALPTVSGTHTPGGKAAATPATAGGSVRATPAAAAARASALPDLSEFDLDDLDMVAVSPAPVTPVRALVLPGASPAACGTAGAASTGAASRLASAGTPGAPAPASSDAPLGAVGLLAAPPGGVTAGGDGLDELEAYLDAM